MSNLVSLGMTSSIFYGTAVYKKVIMQGLLLKPNFSGRLQLMIENMTNILAIDASTDACSAALLFNQEIIDRLVVAPQQHTNFIIPMVNELLVCAQLDLDRLDAIAFGSGPGSFTGTRLAASIAQGFAFAANLPVIKISTLRALAQEVWVEFQLSKVVVVQDARMQEIFLGKYQVDNDGIMRAVEPDKLTKPNEVGEIFDQGLVGVGNGFEVYHENFAKFNLITVARQYVQAKYIAQLAAADFTQGIVVGVEEALPTYLREKVTGTLS